MGREENYGGSGDNAAMTLGLGFLAGLVIGVGVGLLVAPRDGETLRHDLKERAKNLKDAAGERAHQATDVAEDLFTRGREAVDRVRTAATEGLREARRHAAVRPDPRDSDLAGVAGTAESI
jgi:gas vesicle protein